MPFITVTRPEHPTPPAREIKLSCASEVEDTLTFNFNGTDYVFTCAAQRHDDADNPYHEYTTVIVGLGDMVTFLQEAARMLGYEVRKAGQPA